jgi:hypothetical protein
MPGFKGLKRTANLFSLLSFTPFRCHRPKQSNSFCTREDEGLRFSTGVLGLQFLSKDRTNEVSWQCLPEFMSHEETYEIYLLSLIMADVTLPVMTGAIFVSCRKHVMFLCTMGTRTTHMDLRKIASLCTHV